MSVGVNVFSWRRAQSLYGVPATTAAGPCAHIEQDDAVYAHCSLLIAPFRSHISCLLWNTQTGSPVLPFSIWVYLRTHYREHGKKRGQFGQEVGDCIKLNLQMSSKQTLIQFNLHLLLSLLSVLRLPKIFRNRFNYVAATSTDSSCHFQTISYEYDIYCILFQKYTFEYKFQKCIFKSTFGVTCLHLMWFTKNLGQLSAHLSKVHMTVRYI